MKISIRRTTFRVATATAFLFVAASGLLGQGAAPTWTLFPLPTIAGASQIVIADIDGSNPNDVWAVGSYVAAATTPNYGPTQLYSLVLHYDGFAWTEISIPGVPGPGNVPIGNQLGAVKAFSPADVWVGGSFRTVTSPFGLVGWDAMALHWDGLSWTIANLSLPTPNAIGAEIRDIDGATPTDVWFTGHRPNAVTSLSESFALHYDGTNFQIVSVPWPTANIGGSLKGCSAVSSNDVFAVGGNINSGTSSRHIVRWNGSTWNAMSAPAVGLTHDFFVVDALSSSDVWASGYATTATSGTPMVMHYDGTSWTSLPAAGDGRTLTALSSTEVLAGNIGGVWRWNGSAWSQETAFPTLTLPYVSRMGKAGGRVWAFLSAPFNGLNPVLYLAERGAVTISAQASTRTPCVGIAPPQSLQPLLLPTVGGLGIVEVNDPTSAAGLTAGGTFSYWIVSVAPQSNAPCGALLPGAGYGGQPSELLVDLTPGGYAVVDSPQIWGGPGAPAWHALAIPGIPGLAGFPLFTQAALVDYAVAPPRAVLSEALDVVIGS